MIELSEGKKGVKNAKHPQGSKKATKDYDGDGDASEGLSAEISTMEDMLYTAIQAYAKDKVGAPIVYSGSSYPYFFNDANGNGQIDDGEAAYASWTPRLLRAAYNYQWVQKDPGAFAHNGKFIIPLFGLIEQSLGFSK
jgi:hypothetical protein